MQTIRGRFATVVACLVVSIVGSAHAAIINQFNEAEPAKDATWGATEVGWYYTPTVTFTLTGVETIFGDGANDDVSVAQEVTLEVYGAGVVAPFTGTPAPIYSGTFTPPAPPDAIDWSGITGIGSGPQLDAGSTYFIGFKSVDGIGVNITDLGSNILDFDAGNDGEYGNLGDLAEAADPAVNLPILRISGDLVVAHMPEPASAMVLAIASTVLMRRRRRALIRG